MIISFNCQNCGNQNPKRAKFYDGSLGYEALICTVCGAYHDFDEQGKVRFNEPDDFGKQYIKKYKPEISLPIPALSKEDRQRFLNQTCKSLNPNIVSADEFPTELNFAIFYARYQTLHMQKFGAYLMLSHEIYDRIPDIQE